MFMPFSWVNARKGNVWFQGTRVRCSTLEEQYVKVLDWYVLFQFSRLENALDCLMSNTSWVWCMGTTLLERRMRVTLFLHVIAQSRQVK